MKRITLLLVTAASAAALVAVPSALAETGISSSAGFFYESFTSSSGGSTPTLNGQELQSNFQPCPDFSETCITSPPPAVVTASCNPAGESTITFTREGAAFNGLYGSFTETVTATIGPQNQGAKYAAGSPPTDSGGLNTGPVTSLHADFTITGVDGETVTGSKDSTGITAGNSFGVCRTFDAETTESPNLGALETGYYYRLYAPVAYLATIQTVAGTYSDGGSAEIRLADGFTTFATSPPTNTPTSKDQCKKDGWQALTRADGSPFKNQGDCIQYVNTGK